MVHSDIALKTKPHYANLVAILTVAAALTLISLAADIAERYASTGTSAYKASRKIQGYVRPQAPAQANQDIHGAFKGAQIPQTGDLTVRMSPEDAETLKERFEQAVALLHARQYEYAVSALNQVLELQPKLPEAYVNIGFAYLGLEDWDTALIAFTKASDLKPDQANAYYGMGLALEGKKEYEAALGAMRTFIHFSTPDDPFLAKARSALWEWEAQLGRIPEYREAKEGEESPITIKGSPHQSTE